MSNKKTYAWHVTPIENIEAILSKGLIPLMPEPNGESAISLFKTERDAFCETNQWLRRRWDDKPLCLITIDVTGLPLTEMVPFEFMTATLSAIEPSRITRLQPFNPI